MVIWWNIEVDIFIKKETIVSDATSNVSDDADWSMDRKDRILYLVNLGRGWLPRNNHSSEIDLRPMKITYSGRGSISIFSLSFHKTLIPRIKISLFPNIPDIRYSNVALLIQWSNKIIFSNPRLNSTRYYLKTRAGEKKRRNKMIRWKRIARNFLSYKKENKKKKKEREIEKKITRIYQRWSHYVVHPLYIAILLTALHNLFNFRLPLLLNWLGPLDPANGTSLKY